MAPGSNHRGRDWNRRHWARDVLHIGTLLNAVSLGCFIMMCTSATTQFGALEYLSWGELKHQILVTAESQRWCATFFNGTLRCSGLQTEGYLGLSNVVMRYTFQNATAKKEVILASSYGSDISTCGVPLGILCTRCSTLLTTAQTFVALGLIANVATLMAFLYLLHIPSTDDQRFYIRHGSIVLGTWMLLSASIILGSTQRCLKRVANDQETSAGPMVFVAALAMLLGIALAVAHLLVHHEEEEAFSRGMPFAVNQAMAVGRARNIWLKQTNRNKVGPLNQNHRSVTEGTRGFGPRMPGAATIAENAPPERVGSVERRSSAVSTSSATKIIVSPSHPAPAPANDKDNNRKSAHGSIPTPDQTLLDKFAARGATPPPRQHNATNAPALPPALLGAHPPIARLPPKPPMTRPIMIRPQVVLSRPSND
eukprot:m.423 g.423  ORF g.423 m.423 type:complete len:425 (+) comp257_c0_seq2:155-1429(+)